MSSYYYLVDFHTIPENSAAVIGGVSIILLAPVTGISLVERALSPSESEPVGFASAVVCFEWL